MLDLDYAEDSEAETDANFVMTGNGRIVEVQGTAEKTPFTEEQFLSSAGAREEGRDQARRPAEAGGDVSDARIARRSHRPIAGRLVIATHNAGQAHGDARAARAVRRSRQCRPASSGSPSPRRPARAFRDNARIKAVAAATGIGLPAFADDSGLAVDALDGAARHPLRALGRPGTGFRLRHADKSKHELLERGATAGQHSAARISSRRSASPGRTDTSRNSRRRWTARWSGRRAAHAGFGYDPMFLPDGHDSHLRRDAERGEARPAAARQQALSHRARAFLKLAEACLAQR